jgi:hypothetical protein
MSAIIKPNHFGRGQIFPHYLYMLKSEKVFNGKKCEKIYNPCLKGQSHDIFGGTFKNGLIGRGQERNRRQFLNFSKSFPI